MTISARDLLTDADVFKPGSRTAPCGCTFAGRFRSSRGCTGAGARYQAGEITGRQLNAHMNAAGRQAVLPGEAGRTEPVTLAEINYSSEGR